MKPIPEHTKAPLETFVASDFPKRKVNRPMIITQSDGTQIGVVISIEKFNEIQAQEATSPKTLSKIEAFMKTVKEANKHAVACEVDEEDYYNRYL